MANISAEFAFIFPGQGSQKIAMLADMAQRYSQINRQFIIASEVLGYDLWDLLQHGKQEQINMTEVTQPLLLTASVALWNIWYEHKQQLPVAMAGHSLGEWSALVAANVVDFSDAVGLVRNRGAYMQSACQPGEGLMFAVIGLADDKVEDICRDHSIDQFVAPVNYNSPGQLVIAGYAKAAEDASQACKAAGAKMVVPLPVSAPFHTPLMKPAANKLADEILVTEFNQPICPIIHNATVESCADAQQIQQLMIEQITAPVPWTQCIAKLQSMAASQMVECGPGKVLAGLNRRIDRSIKTYNVDSEDSMQQILAL